MTRNEHVPSHRILVIDDNAEIHEDFRKILINTPVMEDRLIEMESTLFDSETQAAKRVSFEIDFAFQGREGLNMVKQARSEGRPYSLAFVDGRMPPGWDGIETIGHLWQGCSDLQVVLCTAYADYSWQDICRVLGETDNLLILKKPFDNVEVLQMVHSLTRKWELTRQVQNRIENMADNIRQQTQEKKHIGAVLEAALNHSPAGIIIADTKDADIRYVNPAALRILDNIHLFSITHRTDAHNTDWQAFRPDGAPCLLEDLPLFRATIKGEIIQNEEFFIRRIGGQDKWISSHAAPVFDPDGQISAGILIFEDITELRKAQAEKLDFISTAAEAEKMALVGQIAGKMAHDFNNVLGAIMGNSELALMDCSDIETKKRLSLIYDQTLRGKNLTKNLVAFARDQEPRYEFFKIDEKIELVINLLKRDLEDIHVVCKYMPESPELMADPGMIEHAVMNLIQNSIHAVSLTRHPEITILVSYQDGQIILQIEDNGCGIPEAFIEEIFTPAFTLKGSKDKNGLYQSDIKGTGYGMANVKKYITQHNGHISIISRPHEGTKITIALPVIHKRLTEQELSTLKENDICSGKHILLVEDEATISEVQNIILSQEPCYHQVDIAENGSTALNLLEKNQYDMISLDYILPGKTNGMDIYHHIRKTNRNVPILFVSGNIEFLESIRELKQKDPYIDHLSKPCKNTEYIHRINILLRNTLG